MTLGEAVIKEFKKRHAWGAFTRRQRERLERIDDVGELHRFLTESGFPFEWDDAAKRAPTASDVLDAIEERKAKADRADAERFLIIIFSDVLLFGGLGLAWMMQMLADVAKFLRNLAVKAPSPPGVFPYRRR